MPNYLRTAATALHGRFLRFGQRCCTSHYAADDPNKGGVCRALCMAHCGLLKIGNARGIRSAIGGGEKYERALAAYTGKLQGIPDDIDLGANLEEAIAALYRKQAPIVALKFLDVNKYTWDCKDKIVQMTAAPMRDGFFNQVWFPGHVISTYQIGENADIFDPNFGVARVSRNNLKTLFQNYISNHLVDYRLTNGSEIYLATLY